MFTRKQNSDEYHQESSIAASSSIPWIYMAQFLHTLKEDGSKYQLRFMLDKKELTPTLDDFRQIFYLSQATANNHNSFVPPPSFSDMVTFYKQVLGFTMELKTQSNFKTTGLLQPWQTLCKIFSKCLTTVSLDGPIRLLQICKCFYCFVITIHVYLAELLWEGLYYSLHHPTSSIHIQNIQVIDTKKQVECSTAWMITDEMKHTEQYRIYVDVFGIDVPMTQSQSTESTYGTHRTTSAPRRSTRLTPPAPVTKVDKADEMILQDTLQVSLAEHKSREEQEARENVALVDEHLASEEIDKMVEGQENVVDDSSFPRNDESNIPGTRIEPQSDKESPEVEMLKKRKWRFLNRRRLKSWKQIENESANVIPSQVDASVRSYMSGHILHVHRQSITTLTLFQNQQYQLYLAMKADPQLHQTRHSNMDDHHDDAHPEGENSAKRQKTSEYEAYVSGESSSGQVFQEEQALSTLENQEQDDDFDFWTDSYASDDDEIPMKQVSQDIMEEVSLTIDEAKMRKMADEMMRQRCTSGDEHQYHIDQMKNFLKSDIVGRNPHAKIFYIRKQKEPGKSKEEIYSNSKIVQVIKTYWELGHEHKFITEIVARRANDCIVSITEPDYKNLNKNDIEDIYLLIMNVKNSKKEKRVMRHLEIHKFCDATLNRVLEGLKSYNNDVKYGYVQKDLTKDETEYLKLFEEEIEASKEDEKMGDGLEVGWIRRIQELDTTYWGFLGVGTTLVFQNFDSDSLSLIRGSDTSIFLDGDTAYWFPES
ncbi:hypothetical protein Tco_0620216 [Tanacetum coccineum]